MATQSGFISTPEPRYRYREEAPEIISVPVDELLERLPTEYRSEGNFVGRMVDLPCREVLKGNTPRMHVGVLSDLLPDAIRIPEGVDRTLHLHLPPGWLVNYYRLVTRRDELPAEATALAETSPADEITIKPISGLEVEVTAKSIQDDEPIDTIEEGKEVHGGEPDEVIGPLGKPKQEEAPVAEKPPTNTLETPLETQNPLAVKSTPTLGNERKRGIFASWPIFRRHHPEAVTESSPAPVTTVAGSSQGNVTPDPPHLAPKTSETTLTSEESSRTLTLEPLWKLDPKEPLADPSALQALFMTEEKLTLEQVIGLAGQLPGLSACILAHGDQVVCASNSSPGVDLRTLSEQAVTMLSQIRISSAQMGLGKVPAVTLHADRGIVSFLHNGELCLMVLHADRGFVPGVRERLQEMLAHFVSAKPVLTGRGENEDRKSKEELY